MPRIKNQLPILRWDVVRSKWSHDKQFVFCAPCECSTVSSRLSWSHGMDYWSSWRRESLPVPFCHRLFWWLSGSWSVLVATWRCRLSWGGLGVLDQCDPHPNNPPHLFQWLFDSFHSIFWIAILIQVETIKISQICWSHGLPRLHSYIYTFTKHFWS